jgi:FixJ family two-component response regulator
MGRSLLGEFQGNGADGVRQVSTQSTQLRASAPIAVATADVAIVDPDVASRIRLGRLLESVGLHPVLFAGPNDVPEHGTAQLARCLLMEVRLKGASGLDFHAKLLSQNVNLPVVFMTAHGDIQMAVRGMKAGAVDFLAKPLREQDVLDAVTAALERERQLRHRTQRVSDLHARLAALTHRESQILVMATAGLLNKQIAAEIGLSEVTVKMHRGSLMRKMGARTVAELTRMAAVLEVSLQASSVQGTAASAGSLRMAQGWPFLPQVGTRPPGSGIAACAAGLVAKAGNFAHL